MSDSPYSPLPKFVIPADHPMLDASGFVDAYAVGYHALEHPAGQSAGERVAAILDDAGFGDALPEPGAEIPHVPERRGALESLADLAAPLIASTMYSMTMVTKMAHVIPLTPELAAEVADTSEAQAAMVRLLNGTATPEEKAAAEERRAAWQAARD
jgi:hypothetical protein